MIRNQKRYKVTLWCLKFIEKFFHKIFAVLLFVGLGALVILAFSIYFNSANHKQVCLPEDQFDKFEAANVEVALLNKIQKDDGVVCFFFEDYQEKKKQNFESLYQKNISERKLAKFFINHGFVLFSIIASLLTIVGVLLAVAEIRLRFEKIIHWEDLLNQMSTIVDEAKEYVFFYTWYPSVGMGSLLNSNGNDHKKQYKKFKELLNKRRNEIPVRGVFLKNDDKELLQRINSGDSTGRGQRDNEIFKVSEQYSRNNDAISIYNNLRYECDTLIRELMSPSTTTLPLKAGKERVVYMDEDSFSGYHLFFSEKEAVIFVPLNLEGGTGGKLQKVDFIGNATLDTNLIDMFDQLVTEKTKSTNLDWPLQKTPTTDESEAEGPTTEVLETAESSTDDDAKK